MISWPPWTHQSPLPHTCSTAVPLLTVYYRLSLEDTVMLLLTLSILPQYYSQSKHWLCLCMKPYCYLLTITSPLNLAPATLPHIFKVCLLRCIPLWLLHPCTSLSSLLHIFIPPQASYLGQPPSNWLTFPHFLHSSAPQSTPSIFSARSLYLLVHWHFCP